MLLGKRPHQKQATAIKKHGKCTEKNCSREYDCLAKIGTKETWHVVTGKLGQSNVKEQHYAPTRTDNKRQKYMKKKSPFVADFDCNR